jgi:hypothetical protein
MNDTIFHAIDLAISELVARMEARQPIYEPDSEWTACMSACDALRKAKKLLEQIKETGK